MTWHTVIGLVLAVGIAFAARSACAQPTVEGVSAPVQTEAKKPFLLGPPTAAGPVVVRVELEVYDINEVNDGAETFTFSGVLKTHWHDPRQSFDPAAVGADEKIFQGDYQFNEVSTGWYPQLVLVNAAGPVERQGVVLRVRPDGSSTLVETLNITAKSYFSMKRFPFDKQHLEAVFEVLGSGRDEVVLQAESDHSRGSIGDIDVPQWYVSGIGVTVRDRAVAGAGSQRASSVLVLGVDLQRESFFVVRLVVIPLVVIVLLSFSVFWMDRSSLGDRISVSFIGILTAVSYQIVMSDNLPHISYSTLIHGFLNLSFLTMSATVVINLVVGAMDKRGKYDLGDRIDRRCRRIFPIGYFGLNLVMLAVALLYF